MKLKGIVSIDICDWLAGLFIRMAEETDDMECGLNLLIRVGARDESFILWW